MPVAVVMVTAMRKIHHKIKVRDGFFLAIFIILFIQPAGRPIHLKLLPGDRQGRQIGINRRKSLSTSVGARAVKRRGEGLYGRPCGPCPSVGYRWNLSVNGTPGAGGHKGPPTTPPHPRPYRTLHAVLLSPRF